MTRALEENVVNIFMDNKKIKCTTARKFCNKIVYNMNSIPTETILGEVSAFFLARQEVGVGTSQKKCRKIPS